MKYPLPHVTGALALVAILIACDDGPLAPVVESEAGLPATLSAAPPASAPATAVSNADLARLRRATARYHDVDVAIADGYLAPPPEACVASPAGGMGYHFVNPGNIDLTIDPDRPEVLLYEPMANGKLRLVGAEFLVHGDAWDAVNAEAPSFAGYAFDPPADRSAVAPPGPFYTLHVWIWRENPSGMVAPFNPRVSCP